MRDVSVLVVGNGMVGHRFVESFVELRPSTDHGVVVIGEEPRRAYDRVHLSSLFDGMSADELLLGRPELYEQPGVELVVSDPVTALDLASRIATTASGRQFRYQHCLLATGSAPFVPPIDGTTADGVFVYRTIEDLDGIRERAATSRRGIVVGGGLLGLEAANALRLLGIDTTVVEFAPRLMAVQLDDGGAQALRRHVEGLGIAVRTGAAATAVVQADGGVTGLALADGDVLPADMVVFAAGIRPRDQLARECGLTLGERGGVVVDDSCRTSDPFVSAIGEVACHGGRVYGLVAPGYRMAEVVASRLAGNGEETFIGADLSTRLKLLGADVASVGDPHADGDHIVLSDPRAGVYSKVTLAADGTVVGAVLVGDTAPFMALVQALRNQTVVTDPLALLRPAATSADGEMADSAGVCSCHNVTCGTVRAAVSEGFEDVAGVKACTKAGTGCGSCVPLLQQLIDGELVKSGRTVVRQLCRHFAMTRPELFEVVRASGIRTFDDLIARHGTGHGCEICKPVAASIFASLGSGYILDGEQASLQDSNDHFLANLQRDGTYSVIPRVPGGEITPDQLIAIGEVARDFDLYTKITGGQRIDLLGARVEHLPKIWERLIAAGMESGHAYGKALRTVKSCVGTTWCRYGVQDSTTMAIELEMRYRGLRAPHKIKMAVSGCARECAEAQSKDVGVIATERGWNLYVGGNGGMRPAHAELLAEDLDDATLIRSIDRYLMWYVRTAERLERTAPWQRKLPGGIDFVRRVVMDDELGLAAEFEAQMAAHVATYECEWTATLESPERMERFVSFVNTDEPDPTVTMVEVRGQKIPAGATR
jgi:nitrite reductase (NADH) large subunit